MGDQKFVFQGVGMIFSGGFDDRKWTEPESERESRFVFIGKNLNHEFLRDGFMACRVTDDLRFKIGDVVEVLMCLAVPPRRKVVSQPATAFLQKLVRNDPI